MKHVSDYKCFVTVKEGIPACYGIEIKGAKVIDLLVNEYPGGCRCSTCNDRNKYDKESGTIICKSYNECLATVWKHLQEGQKSDITETVKMALGEE